MVFRTDNPDHRSHGPCPYENDIEDLRRAILDAGPHPAYHYLAVYNLRHAWPTLYGAIAGLMPSMFDMDRMADKWPEEKARIDEQNRLKL